jgi:hypothetical protein
VTEEKRGIKLRKARVTAKNKGSQKIEDKH